MRCFLMLTAVINRKRVAMHAPGPSAMACPLKKQKLKKNASLQLAAMACDALLLGMHSSVAPAQVQNEDNDMGESPLMAMFLLFELGTDCFSLHLM